MALVIKEMRVNNIALSRENILFLLERKIAEIVFLDARGIVSQIAHSAAPDSLDPIESEQSIKAVLEVPSGAASSWGIEIGSRMVFDQQLCVDP